MLEPTRSRVARSPFAMAVAAMLAVAAIMILVVRAGDAGPPSVAEPEVTNIQIVSMPPGASVVRADDGGVIGITPLITVLPKSDTDLLVIVRHEGFQERRVTVPLFSANGRIDVTLTAIGADAAAPPSPRDHRTP